MKFALAFSTLLISFLLPAQESATFRPIIVPSDAIVKVNNQLVKNGEIINLAPGKYVIESWAPRFTLVKDTVEIAANESFVFRKGLKILADDFIAFRASNQVYRNKKLNRNLTTIGYSAIGLGVGYLVINQLGRDFDDLIAQANETNRRIENSINQQEADFFTARFNAEREQYDKERRNRNTIVLVSTPVGALAIGLAIRAIIKNSKSKIGPKPVYEAQNPFTSVIRSATPNFNLTADRSMNFGFTFKF